MTDHNLDLSQALDYRGRQQPPCYATMHAAGIDLSADLDAALTIHPGNRRLVPTGLYLRLPENSEMQVRPRSGLASQFGVVAFAGTVDADYREQVWVLLFNHGDEPFTVHPGQRIAQGVFAPVIRAVQGFTKDTKETRAGGFGSTGA